MMAEQITEEDEEALKYLQNIAVTFHDDMVVWLFYLSVAWQELADHDTKIGL